MKWWKRIWYRIIYMTTFNQIVKELKSRGISSLSTKEEQIIIFHLSLKENPHTIVALIARLRSRSILIERLAALGINEADLTPGELDWIEEILGNGRVSIDEAVKEIREARSHNRNLKDSKTM